MKSITELDAMGTLLIRNADAYKGGPRKTFPCDVRAIEAKREKRQEETEVSMASLDGFVSSEPEDDHLLPCEWRKIMAEVAMVHPRAQSWVLAKLDGMTEVEIAKEWGVGPVCVNRWGYTYSHKIKTVFAKYLETPVDLSLDGLGKTHAKLVQVGSGKLRVVS